MHLLSVRARISKRPPARAQGRLHGAAPKREPAGAGWLHAGPWPLFSKALNRSRRRVSSQGRSGVRRWMMGGLCRIGAVQAFLEQSWTPCHLQHFSSPSPFGGCTPWSELVPRTSSWNCSSGNLREPRHGEHHRHLGTIQRKLCHCFNYPGSKHSERAPGNTEIIFSISFVANLQKQWTSAWRGQWFPPLVQSEVRDDKSPKHIRNFDSGQNTFSTPLQVLGEGKISLSWQNQLPQ